MPRFAPILISIVDGFGPEQESVFYASLLVVRQGICPLPRTFFAQPAKWTGFLAICNLQTGKKAVFLMIRRRKKPRSSVFLAFCWLDFVGKSTFPAICKLQALREMA